MGLGILDAVLLAAFVNVGGIEIEPELVAALVVWRVVTILGPITLGAAAMALWRHSTGGQADCPTGHPSRSSAAATPIVAAACAAAAGRRRSW